MEGGLLANPSFAVLCSVTVVIGWLLHWAYRSVYPPCKGILPPDSMGFPIIGETLQYLKPSHSMDMRSYYCQRLKRYGPVFKTYLVGQPVVISLDPEFDRFIFQQEGKLFRIWYPQTANFIFGKKSLITYTGTVHKFVPSFASKLFGPENLKEVLIQQLEDAMKQGFTAWAAKPSIEVKDAVADMIFDLVAKKVIGFGPEESKELRKNFQDFLKGMLCFPIYFPGTSFYKSMEGRRNVDKKLTQLLKHRLRTPEKKHGDLLDLLVEELRSEKPVIDETFAIDALVAILFGSFATISGVLTVGLKMLRDNPQVVKTLKEEHEAILKKRADRNSGFTWEEYKSLKFTTQVTELQTLSVPPNEITRLSNIPPGIFRRTLTDVQVNGYTIPSGWLVMISPMAVHLNPTLFEDPLKFNPWRWSDETKRSMQQRNFMPFGGGIRLCLGADDFAKLFISLFLHVLVPNYRWIEIKGREVSCTGEMLVPQGYHMQLVPTA
ncbi:cytochrome P450 87A3-like [Miscanthus floridulus]|uniref:cytochrome P450 87A3-like n=1 Tax=Miscanthus floridulus TaxID=154761 RepID=UPI0034581FA9